MAELSKRNDFSSEQLQELNIVRDALAKRDGPLDLKEIYKQIIGITGWDSNVEKIFKSLSKFGLGVNLPYNALIDDGFDKVDVEFIDRLISNQTITLSKLWSVLVLSGVIPQVSGVIIGNSDYLHAVFRFYLGILTGQVPLFQMYKANSS